jgi:ADP-ribose pyrophosphatase YjhB (NUDIX family)
MTDLTSGRYRVSRALGKTITRAAAFLTFGRMPPFVSTSAIVTDGDRLLVVIDPIRREPILPGGHLRWNENPEQAVVREVREETGIVIEPEALVAVVAGEEWTGENGVVRIVYTGSVEGGSLSSSEEGEAAWLPLIQAEEQMLRDAPIVARWRKGS